jgi:hypothetical protein
LRDNNILSYQAGKNLLFLLLFSTESVIPYILWNYIISLRDFSIYSFNREMELSVNSSYWMGLTYSLRRGLLGLLSGPEVD